MNLNYRFHLFRKRLGLNQIELAQNCGVTQGAISNYEVEGTPIPQYIIIILELKFRLNREWLLTGNGNITISDYVLNDSSSIMADDWVKYETRSLNELISDLENITEAIKNKVEAEKKVEKSATKSRNRKNRKE